MGLDMFLFKVKRIGNATLEQIHIADEYLGWKNRGEEYKYCSMKRWCGIDSASVDMNVVKAYEPEYEERDGFESVFEEVAYWRKANQIHAWFVKNVQNGVDDCGEYEVTMEQLESLLDVCNEVIKHHNVAGKLLPTQSGFFFGSTEYDTWYFDDIKKTIEKLNDVLEDVDFDNWIVFYHASW